MWCIRVGQPFGWLILSGAKPLETRKDYKRGPKHLPGLKSGELVLVLLDDQWFPPNASARQREETELEIAQLLSRQNKAISSEPTKEQLGSICGWIRIGKSSQLDEQEVARRGGWDKMENKTLLMRSSLEYKDSAACRWVTEICESGLLRHPIQMTEELLMAKGLFRSPEHVVRADLLPMPPHQLVVTAVPQPSPAITAIIGPRSFSAAARRALPLGGGRGRGRGNLKQQQGGSSSSGASGSSAAADPPANPPVGGRADKAGGTALSDAGNLSAKQIGKLAVDAPPTPTPIHSINLSQGQHFQPFVPATQHGHPRHFHPITFAPLNSHGGTFKAPPSAGARGADGGSHATVRRRERAKKLRQLGRPPRTVECQFTSLSEMLEAAAYESDGLEVGAVENMLTENGYNIIGLFREMVMGGEESFLRFLEALGIRRLGHQRAILRVLKYEAS